MLPILLTWATASPSSTTRVRAWGANAIRIQFCAGECDDTLPGALSTTPPAGQDRPRTNSRGAIASGNLECAVEEHGSVSVACRRVSDDLVLLRTVALTVPAAATGGSVTFEFEDGTVLFGMGQNRPGASPVGTPGGPYDTRSMDVRNQSFDFRHVMGNEGGASNAAPFLMGGRVGASAATAVEGDWTFGLLFNSPSFGGMEIGHANVTCYTAPDEQGGVAPIRKQLDFLVITTSVADADADAIDDVPLSHHGGGSFSIHEGYTAAVGRAPMMPAWAQLYWHCKNRYATQAELLDAARYLHANAPHQVGVLVIDWFHWETMGDWSFDPMYWPDPRAMAEECARYGIQIMASVWPYTCETSRSFDVMNSSGWVASNGSGVPFSAYSGSGCRLVDPSNANAQTYVWSLLNASYAQYGITSFWLDSSEPWHPPSGSAYFGNPLVKGASQMSWADAGAMYDVVWPKLFRDGLQQASARASASSSRQMLNGVLLPRAGWIGSWKFGASLWNGDIGSTFPILATSLKTILSAQLSGFGWMTIDGGGYAGGDSQSPAYRETQLRWMQLSATLPIMRQHGQRDRTIFSWYGTANERALLSLVRLRFNLTQYIGDELAKLAATGRPFNRALNWDFPNEAQTWALAERGLGAQNGPAPASTSGGGGGATALAAGYVVVAQPCDIAPQVHLDAFSGGALRVNAASSPSSSSLCVDSHTLTNECTADRQCEAALWPCEAGAAAHSWARGAGGNDTFDQTLRNVRDVGFVGEKGGAESGGTFCLRLDETRCGRKVQQRAGRWQCALSIGTCNASDVTQQWRTQRNGKITNGANASLCLGAVPPPHVLGIDQFMMGDSMMAAPILSAGARSRLVYFPGGRENASWRHHYSGVVYAGGTTARVPAPLENFPLFHRMHVRIHQ